MKIINYFKDNKGNEVYEITGSSCLIYEDGDDIYDIQDQLYKQILFYKNNIIKSQEFSSEYFENKGLLIQFSGSNNIVIIDKDNKIKKLVEEIEKNYEKYAKETQKLLNKKDLKAKPIGMMAKAMSKMSINKEMISDNSDANIADMLIQGLTMGNLELTKHIDNYEKTADKKIINLAKSLRKFGEEYIEKLKVYL